MSQSGSLKECPYYVPSNLFASAINLHFTAFVIAYSADVGPGSPVDSTVIANPTKETNRTMYRE